MVSNNNFYFINKETVRIIDLFDDNDRFISYGEGKIKLLRILQNKSKLPLVVGEYFYYKIFLEDIIKNNIALDNLLGFLDCDDSVNDFISLIQKNRDFYNNLIKHKKLIIISLIFAHKKYRKKNDIFSKFIKSFHKSNYSSDTMILGYFKPIQYNFYFSKFVASSKHKFLLKSPKVDDYEYNTLKTYSLATKNDFEKINKTDYLFKYSPKK